MTALNLPAVRPAWREDYLATPTEDTQSRLPKLTEPLPEMLARLMETDETLALSIAQDAALNPLAWYCPNRAQERYINAVEQASQESNIPTVLFMAGNGVGKSHATLQMLLNLVYGPQNGWFDREPWTNWNKPKVIWYCTTVDNLQNVVWPELKRLLVGRRFLPSNDGRSRINSVDFLNGWRMMFKTYDQDPKMYESDTVGATVWDEPAPEPLYRAGKSRRRNGAITLLPLTPLDMEPFILDEIERNCDANKAGWHSVEASLFEAVAGPDTRGHLDPDVAAEMVESYDAEERLARVYGQPAFFAGRIYPTFTYEAHVIPDDTVLPAGCRLIHACDPHDGRPSAAIWAAVAPKAPGDPYPRVYILDEYPIDKSRSFWEFKHPITFDAQVEAFCSIEYALEDKLKVRCERHILDRHFGWQTRAGTTLAEMFDQAAQRLNQRRTLARPYSLKYDHSYTSPDADSEIAVGHDTIRRMLEPLPSDGKPAFMVFDKCFHVRNGVSRYCKRLMTNRGGDRADADGRIIERYKDMSDALRYLIMAALELREPTKPIVFPSGRIGFRS